MSLTGDVWVEGRIGDGYLVEFNQTSGMMSAEFPGSNIHLSEFDDLVEAAQASRAVYHSLAISSITLAGTLLVS